MGLDWSAHLMLLYTVQSIILGGALTLFARRSGKFNTYQLLLAPVWTIAVIAIRFRYGLDQIMFYSNDQKMQFELLQRFSPTNITMSLTKLVNDRYVVIIPAWLLKQLGIEPVLAFKFIQALALTFIFRLSTNYLSRIGITVKLWHAIFFAGPLLIFNSTLGLRDLPLALFATYFIIGRSPLLKIIALGLAGLLRPHLAIALLFGWLVGLYLNRFRSKRVYPTIIFLTIVAFFIGGLSYYVGGFIRYGFNISPPAIFTQDTWWRFLANLIGLQFLTFSLDDGIVNLSIAKLLLLRLFFVDTFAVPMLFLFTLINQTLKLSNLRIQVFVSFAFFIGLVAQTNYNSSRQNLPFFPALGILALVGILSKRNENRDLELATSSANPN